MAHPDAKRERFCQLRAAGQNALRAYLAIAGGSIGLESAKVGGYKMGQESPVRLRIGHLQSARAQTVDDLPVFDLARIEEARAELNGILDRTHDRALRLGVGHTDIARVRASISANAARNFRSREGAPPPPPPPACPPPPPIRLEPLAPCYCPGTAWE